MLDAGTTAHQIRVLSGAAGHLASALDVLAASGCDWFAVELLDMLAAIDGQIAVLQQLADEDPRPGLSS